MKRVSLLSHVVGLILVLLTVTAQPVMAQGPSPWSGVCIADADSIGQGDVATIQGLQCLIANVLSVAITFIGLAGFVMIIYGAFRYLISGGNSKGVETARNTLTYSIIGLVVALSAVIVLNLLAAFTGVSLIKTFVIPYQIENLLQ